MTARQALLVAGSIPLFTWVAFGATLGLGGEPSGGDNVVDRAVYGLDRPADSWAAEAQRLTHLVQTTFWNSRRRHYISPVATEGTVATEDRRNRPFHGHTVWAWTEAFRMLAAAASQRPNEYDDQLAEVFAGLERYYDSDRSVYNAWVMFPGNVDSYSDDNAWLAMGFCEATEATGDRRYAARASEIMEGYVHREWRDDDGPLGMRWGFDPDGPRHHNMRAAISASTAAVAAIRVADSGFNVTNNLERARTYLQWIEQHCIDDSGLVMDGLRRSRRGRWEVDQKRWTYNTGLVILANAMLYERTGEPVVLARVRRSADAAIASSGMMYDPLVTDPDRNYFHDTSFFTSHLIEGLVKASQVLDDPRYHEEAERNAAHLYTFVRDPSDGLYFRNMRLWRVDESSYQRFQAAWAGGYVEEELRFRPAADERSREPAELAKPVEQRPLVKTLLGSASVARAFWALAKDEADRH